MRKHIITLDWLIKKNACRPGIDIFKAEFKNKAGLKRVIKYCISNYENNNELFNYANWLLTKSYLFKRFIIQGKENKKSL